MFVATPVREPGMQGFCRRCHGQVMRDSGTCPDCVVVSITPFDATYPRFNSLVKALSALRTYIVNIHYRTLVLSSLCNM